MAGCHICPSIQGPGSHGQWLSGCSRDSPSQPVHFLVSASALALQRLTYLHSSRVPISDCADCRGVLLEGSQPPPSLLFQAQCLAIHPPVQFWPLFQGQGLQGAYDISLGRGVVLSQRGGDWEGVLRDDLSGFPATKFQQEASMSSSKPCHPGPGSSFQGDTDWFG